MENIKLLVKTKLESTMGEHLVTKENSLFYRMKDTFKYWIKKAQRKRVWKQMKACGAAIFQLPTVPTRDFWGIWTRHNGDFPVFSWDQEPWMDIYLKSLWPSLPLMGRLYLGVKTTYCKTLFLKPWFLEKWPHAWVLGQYQIIIKSS